MEEEEEEEEDGDLLLLLLLLLLLFDTLGEGAATAGKAAKRLRSSATLMRAPISKFKDWAIRRFSLVISTKFLLAVGRSEGLFPATTSSTDGSSGLSSPSCGYLEMAYMRSE